MLLKSKRRPPALTFPRSLPATPHTCSHCSLNNNHKVVWCTPQIRACHSQPRHGIIPGQARPGTCNLGTCTGQASPPLAQARRPPHVTLPAELGHTWLVQASAAQQQNTQCCWPAAGTLGTPDAVAPKANSPAHPVLQSCNTPSLQQPPSSLFWQHQISVHAAALPLSLLAFALHDHRRQLPGLASRIPCLQHHSHHHLLPCMMQQ